jgi:hypothetical protein
MISHILLVTASLLAIQSASSVVVNLHKREFTGRITYFDARKGDGGTCMLYDPIPYPNNDDVVALNAPQVINTVTII